MVGPPITMMLMAKGLLSVQQEIEASFLETSIFQDKSIPSSKKRKHDTEMELLGTEKGEPSHTKGNSSKQREKPQILVARMEPAADQTILISTNGTSQFDSEPLTDILQTLNHTSQLLKDWISGAPDTRA